MFTLEYGSKLVSLEKYQATDLDIKNKLSAEQQVMGRTRCLIRAKDANMQQV